MSELVFDLQRFAKTSNLGTLKTLGGIIKTLGLVKLANDLKEASDASKWLKKNANPILKFIGSNTPIGKKFGNYATLITRSISIIDNTLSVLTDKTLPDATRTSKLGLIAGDLEAMALATNKLSSSFKKKNLWFLSIFSAGISLTSNLLAASDGVTPDEKRAINTSYVAFLKSLGSDLVKEIFDAAVEKQLKRAFTEDLTTDLVEDIMTKGKFFQSASKTLTKTFGVVLSFATGVLNAIDEHKARMEKYTADGIPEDIAKHDAFIDALATFVHDTWIGHVKGVDDWIFNFMLGIAGAETDKNYIQVIADRFKTLNYKNSGTSDNDTLLISSENKSYIYGDSGNDSIENTASNVTIWGGHDNDTIWSLKLNNKMLTSNSIFGGSGNDFIFIQDKLSTIYGGNGNDTLTAQGTQNVVYGDAGDNYIFLLEGATENSIRGGAGNDKIYIYNTAKNKFFYSSGDGNDTIYGFGSNDSLAVSGKFSTVNSGSDFKVKVGTGSILLVGAADKKIHINGNVFNDGSSGSETSTPIEIPALPSLPEYPLVSGTLKNDTIKNYRSNVLINGGKGDDSIINGSKYVTIMGGAGNDKICNNRYGSNVSIDSGAGNDSIDNISSNVTINGNEGNDYISTSGYLEFKKSSNHAMYHAYGNENIKIFGGAGDDYITASGVNSVLIDAGDGNDTIYTSDYYVLGAGDYATVANFTIIGGKGDDYIRSSGENNLFKYNIGDGNDTIVGFSASDTLQIGDGSITYSAIGSGIYGNLGDFIQFGRDSILLEDASISSSNIFVPQAFSIQGTKGTDNIENYFDDATIKTQGGNDHIYNEGKNVIIDGGLGNDSIANEYGESVIIDGGAGDDSIENYLGHNVTINAGTGNDYIDNTGASVTVNGGEGNDSIYNYGSSLTVSGGKGNDLISIASYAYHNLIKYSSGDGNDTVYGFNETSTLSISGGTYYTQTNGDNLIVTVGKGKISLIGAANLNTLNIDGVYKDPTLLTVTNSTKSPVTVDSAVKTVDASKRTKAVKITGNKLANTILGGSKADIIFGGKDNDSIIGNADNDSLDGGDGKDTIRGGKGNDKLFGGKGNDSLWGDDGADKFFYSKGDGKDVIFGFDSKDTLTFDNITFKTSMASYNQSKGTLTFNVSGGSVTLKDFTTTTFNINDSTYKLSGGNFTKK